MIKELLYVGAGSFIGGIGRYLISMVMRQTGTGFPWGTFIVNILGCFLIGLFYQLFSKTDHANGYLLLFLTVGCCGGFTTFSTFSKESLVLLQTGHLFTFASYVIASVVLGIVAVACGLWLGKL